MRLEKGMIVRCVYAHNSKLLKRRRKYRLSDVVHYPDGTSYVWVQPFQYQFAARRFEPVERYGVM